MSKYEDNRGKNKVVIICENQALAKSESRKICGISYFAFYNTDDPEILHLQHPSSNSVYCRVRSIRLYIWNYLNEQKQRQIAADTAVCYGWIIGYSLGCGRNTVSSLNTHKTVIARLSEAISLSIKLRYIYSRGDMYGYRHSNKNWIL